MRYRSKNKMNLDTYDGLNEWNSRLQTLHTELLHKHLELKSEVRKLVMMFKDDEQEFNIPGYVIEKLRELSS